MGCLRRLWRTAIEIRASFSETSAEPPHYAIPWALLKQPDKHNAASTSSQAGVSLHAMADAEKALPKHACKGQNDCKGQGAANIQAKTPAKARAVARPTEANRKNRYQALEQVLG